MLEIRVLLIEDDPVASALVRQLLAERGDRAFRIEVATTFAAGLTALDRTSPDLILLDLGLPDGIPGPAMVARFAVRLPDTPIVVVTGHDDDGTAVQCLEAGAQDYLRKNEIGARVLARAMLYAEVRLRAAHEDELRAVIAAHHPAPHAAAPPQESLERRAPRVARAMRAAYRERLAERLASHALVAAGEPALIRAAQTLGSVHASASDLMRVHQRAFDELIRTRRASLTDAPRAIAVATEVLGHLADYYRGGSDAAQPTDRPS